MVKYFCDICLKEMRKDERYSIEIDSEYDIDYTIKRNEICKQCANQLVNKIKNMTYIR